MKIAIIGSGNLGLSIADGLIQSKYAKANQIILTRRNLSALETYRKLGCTISNNNKQATKDADIIILAIKPYNILEVSKEIKSALTVKKIVISVVTGVWMKNLRQELGKNTVLFRAMPNTAIAIKQSMTCLCHDNADKKSQEIVDQIFSTVGKTIFIHESLMDAATVLGACGTAYAMRFIRANIQGGIEIGFSAKDASLIAAQTIKGAAQLLLEKDTHPEQEIDKVTTPKGCTIAGLNEMEHQGFSSSLIKGIAASYNKIIQ